MRFTNSELEMIYQYAAPTKAETIGGMKETVPVIKDRNEYISRLCSFPLLILDDFGMERGTEYGLEQVYNVVDSRYRSRKPLIVTTNLTLEELQNPEDTPHARIYDRLIEMCSPVCITGENFWKAKAREKMEQLKTLLNRKESL